MKVNILTTVVILASIVGCNQPIKKGETNQTETTRLQAGPMPDTNGKVQQSSGVYFVNLKDGENVQSPLYVEMGVKGMDVEPAGKVVEAKGHHHLIIDGDYEEKGKMVPKDATHIHYGKGQTSDTLKLSPGSHSLTLQFANGIHESYGKEWSKTITIIVDKAK